MGWVEAQFQDQNDAENQPNSAATAAENLFQQKALNKWATLLGELQNDVEEFRRITGRAEFDQRGDFQCRISNPQARVAVVLTADLPQHAIRYSYEPADAYTAVPEEGMLTLRLANGAMELYSADERMTSEQARRLVLEPLLFPRERKNESPAA